MGEFSRKIDQLAVLVELASKPESHWWKDLLSLWRPSGVQAGEYGLRLAIRNGYMNLYRHGQSIARVEVDRKGVPTATIHIKYVGLCPDKSLKQSYVQLRHGWLLHGKEKFPYQGIEDLRSWIRTVDGQSDSTVNAGYTGPEKVFVDQLVAANPNVIDLEMGLPAWGDQKTAPRMDLVAIEVSPEGGKVVFWEAKRVTDSRIRCEEGKKPEVLKQLDAYRLFLNEPRHVELVALAYRNTAKILVKLREMADGLGEVHPLGNDLLAAASMSELGVDHKPRLVVFNQEKASQAAWAIHAARLRGLGVVMTTIDEGSPFVLRSQD
ncbi:MAG: hypothetical protein ACYCX0_09750 [Desulfurivibrionaceae bacterium]